LTLTLRWSWFIDGFHVLISLILAPKLLGSFHSPGSRSLRLACEDLRMEFRGTLDRNDEYHALSKGLSTWFRTEAQKGLGATHIADYTSHIAHNTQHHRITK
jgi:hypothetical protein